MPPEQRTTAGQAKASVHKPNAKDSPAGRDQNGQNSNVTDGAYFWLDGYASVSGDRSHRVALWA